MKHIGKLLLAAPIIFLSAACSSKSSAPATEESPLSVETYQPTMLDGEGLFISGAVSAEQTAMISTRHMGYVERIYVKQGDAVKAGQLLLTVNSADLQARRSQAEAMIAEAKAAAASAEKDLQRFRALHAQKSVSDKELENVELNHTSMQSKLKMAQQARQEVKAMLAYTAIKAPFSGVVTQKMVDAGSMANPGQPLLVIEQDGRLNITASLPESYLAYVKVGDTLHASVKALGGSVTGVVTELSPSASMTGGSYQIKVMPKGNFQGQLRAGMYAALRIPVKGMKKTGQRVWVESASVVRRNQLTGLYVVSSDGKAQLRWVRLGDTSGDRVEVLSGLNAQEKVIRTSKGKLYNGRKITIANPAK